VSGTALLCLMSFCNTVCIGAFGPLLPEIGRAQALADWELGILAGSFGFARMAADVPTGWLAGRRLGTTLALAPVVLLAGLLLLGTGGALPVLVLGRILTGLAHTLGMVGGLTAVLQDHRGPSASVRLNTFEFSGMFGILGGLAAVGMLPARWSWNLSLLAASSPLLVTLLLAPRFRRRFPDEPRRSGVAPPSEAATAAGPPLRTEPLVRLMFAVGAIMALSWSSVSQFIVPLRGPREFGLDRAGVSWMLGLAQLVDLVALLPVGWLADRVGRLPVLAAVSAVLGLGTWGAGLGPFPLFASGCVLFGLGLAGWMLPLGVIREHTTLGGLAWRTGLYRVGVDAAIFLGPLICGFLGEGGTGIFVALVGLAALATAAHLGWRVIR
jgi:MFS family permease